MRWIHRGAAIVVHNASLGGSVWGRHRSGALTLPGQPRERFYRRPDRLSGDSDAGL